ncbi:high mobility group B2-like protein [Labeo rohita]|uniref:High mobility group protein B2 n=2 Tax=Labeonini TaxID=2743697 RepID=A0A498LD75_LABRO|nr:high mobility group B2-like protein [Labeo rohita]
MAPSYSPEYSAGAPGLDHSHYGGVPGAGAVGMGPRTVKRRPTANRKERRRTQSINSAFAELRECIPNVPADTKLSKIKTLRLATSYIAYLMDILDKDEQNGEAEAFKAEFKKTDAKEERRKKEMHITAMGKDPNKPRGKTSSYAFFVQTCREEHKKKNPGTSVNFSEFSKKCSERWKTMSSKEKAKFEEMAKTDKVRYDREMKNYVPPKGAKGGKKKKDPNAPKRPPSAFFVFCSDHRPKVKNDNPGISIGDIAKKLGDMWSKLSPKEKSPYEQKAMKLKEKYEKTIFYTS